MFEWKVFFSCVVGFFALAADPKVFALRRVGNLGLWIFTNCNTFYRHMYLA